MMTKIYNLLKYFIAHSVNNNIYNKSYKLSYDYWLTLGVPNVTSVFLNDFIFTILVRNLVITFGIK